MSIFSSYVCLKEGSQHPTQTLQMALHVSSPRCHYVSMGLRKQCQTTLPFQVLKCLGHESLFSLEEIEMSHNFQRMEKSGKLFQLIQLFHLFLPLVSPFSNEPRQGPATQLAQGLHLLHLPSSWEAARPLSPLAGWVGHRDYQRLGDQSETISIWVWYT